MSVKSFQEIFVSSFASYVEHIVISWYLRNAKAECFSTDLVPPHMMWMIADFAQNIKVEKRWETAEEYFKRHEIALHGIISGIAPVSNPGSYEISHVTSSDFR
jgi:hypothetical protein